MRRLLAAMLATPLVVTACGGADPGPSGLSSGVAAQLQTDVFALTQAAAAKDWTTARTRISALRADLAAFRASDAISDAQAQQLEATIAQVTKDLPAIPAATTTPSATKSGSTPARAPAPAPAPKPRKHGHGDH